MMAVYAVLGAGSGGQTLAAFLKSKGHTVRIWNRSREPLMEIQDQGGIELQGALNLKACPDLFSTDIGDTVDQARIIFVVVPANAHYDVAKLIAPFLQPSQIVILNPGRTGGALEWKETVKKFGCEKTPLVIETQSLLFACRKKGFGLVEVLAIKRENTLASIPKVLDHEIVEELSSIYKGLRVAESTLYTSFENIGAILHPAPVLLVTGWIESRDTFFPHYYYGISKSIAAFLEKMDSERLAIADAYGQSVRSVKKWHEDMYGYVGTNLFETLQLNVEYASIDAPYSLRHRYLLEDVPTGLVPISELGRAAGVSTKYMDMIIDLADAILEKDFREEGRSFKRLGLQGKTVSEIKKEF